MPGAAIDCKVLILGAGGRTGRLAAQALVDRGFAVRAMVRDVAKASQHIAGEAELVAGDLREDDAVSAAVRGAEVVVFTAAGVGAVGVSPDEVDFQGVRRVACACKASGVRHLSVVSSAGVTQPEHPHNCTIGGVLRWKRLGEQALRASGAPYTIVRALGLRDRGGGLQGVRMTQGDRIAFGEDIARADVAAFLADLALVGAGVGFAGGPFAPGFDRASLFGATIEIYNDRTIAPGIYDTARRPLEPDGP